MGMGIDKGKPAMEIDAEEFLQSSASPTCSAARLAEIKRELRSLCPSEAYHAANKVEAELIANRMMDRVAELLNMIQSR